MKKKYKLLSPKISINWKLDRGSCYYYTRDVYFYLTNGRCYQCKTYSCWFFAKDNYEVCSLCCLINGGSEDAFYQEMTKKAYNYWKKNDTKKAAEIFAKMFISA